MGKPAKDDPSSQGDADSSIAQTTFLAEDSQIILLLGDTSEIRANHS